MACLGMGQPLKSFRDGAHAFPPYAKSAISRPLKSLGELRMPGGETEPSRSETDQPAPRVAQGS